MNLKNKTSIAGYVLAFLSAGVLLNSSYFFLVVAKLNVGEWLAFNACSVAIMAYLICFVLFHMLKKEFLLAIPLLPLYYYGTMGLFVMPWSNVNIFAHVTHLIISINVLWILYFLLKERKFESIGKGLLIGIFVFVPVFAYIHSFNQVHMAEILKVIQSI